MARLKRMFREAIEILKESSRAYLAMNAAYYGLIIIGMIAIAFDPALQQELLQLVGGAFEEGPLAVVGEAYGSADVLSAVVLTFAVNLGLGSFLSITLPSLIVPFSGLFVGGYRALLWGLLFSPTTPEMARLMIPHALTLILEGQAYIIVMLAAFLQGKAFLWPKTVRAKTRRQGYRAGLRLSLRLYLLAVVILAIAACYEVFEAIYLIPLLL
ncbi:MAG: hypothetical protein PHV57_04035 [Methanomicrobiaceae archaeon]|nr:hypothetical protein [Methanomicrobiaceae archaeon]